MMPFMILANPAFATFLPEPWNQYANETWVIATFVILTFVLMIPIIFISTLAQSATTYGALKAEKGAEKLAFRELFNESLPYFWRLLGLYLLFGGAWMVIWFGFMAVFLGGSMLTMGLATICFFPLFLLAIPVLLVGFSVLELAQAAIVADNMGTLEAIAHGWKLFRANVLSVVVLMVILYFALYLLSSIVILPMMFPMMLFPMGMDTQGNFNNFMPVFFFVVFPLMFFVMIAVQGILMAFFQSAWAVTYLRLSNNANTPIVLEEKPQEAGV
jgi:hypothetical protein